MILYELTSPVEHKFGGVLTDEEASRCTQQTDLDSPRWTPYPYRPARVENICGRFVVRVEGAAATARGGTPAPTEGASGGEPSENYTENYTEKNYTEKPSYMSCLGFESFDPRLSSVCLRVDSPFGRPYELSHLSGHVTVRCTPGLPRSVVFKGVKGFSGTRELLQDLFVPPETLSLVHMAVMSSCLGVRLQTSHNCYLENRINGGAPWISVESRAMDQSNVVRLSVLRWPSELLAGSLLPTSHDIVITGRGSAVHRMTWPNLEWTEEAERAVLAACDWVSAQIIAMC